MRETVEPLARAAHETDNLRCLIQQQIRIIDTAGPHSPDHREAAVLLRRLMRHHEAMRTLAPREGACPAA